MINIDIDIRKLRLNNGKTIEQMLKSEAKRFLKILQQEIDNWYKSYSPTFYKRTYNMRHSLYVEDYVAVSVDARKLTININYTDDALSTGYWGQGPVNTLQLMNDGYSVHKNVWFRDIEHFGYVNGAKFFERAIERFNIDNQLGIVIDIQERSG